MGKISCIIPTLNRHKLLFQLLNSFKNQTVLPDEIIIIDQSDSIDSQVSEEYNRLKGFLNLKVYHTKRLGSGGARNFGICKTQYPLLVFIDDDVVIPFNDLFEQYHNWFENKVIEAVDGGYFPYENRSNFDRHHVNLKTLDVIDRLTTTYYREDGIARPVIGLCGGNFAVRRSAIMRVGGFDARFGLGEDREMGIRLWKSGAVIVNDAGMRIQHLKYQAGGLRTYKKKTSKYLKVPDPKRFLYELIHFHFYVVLATYFSILGRSFRITNPKLLAKFPLHGITLTISLLKAMKEYRTTKPMYVDQYTEIQHELI